MAHVHSTAIIAPGAELATGVHVGPYAVIGARVVVGAHTRIGAHAFIGGNTVVGQKNEIYPFAVIGTDAQVRKKDPVKGGASSLRIGDQNVIREHVTIHASTPGGATVIGAHNLFMVSAHVAHDVTIGDHATIANGVQLAGHSFIGDHVTFGGLAGVAQFVRVGQGAFVAAGAMCERDVPPFCIVQGDRARVRALNKVGLSRREVPVASVRALEKAFRAIFRADVPRAQALTAVDRSDEYVRALCEFLELAPLKG